MIPALRNLSRTTIQLLILGTLAPLGAAGQVVPLRTVPLPAGEQFLVVPTRTLGMGSASIALDDAWQDPFVNPARGARNESLRFFSLPTFYGADGVGDGGATLPLAFLARSGRLFGGGGIAWQSPDDPNASWTIWAPAGVGGTRPDEGPPSNRYAYGLIGWTLADGRTSLGAGVSAAELDNVSGVDRLYSNRTWLSEHGRTRDYRVGVLRELGGGSSVEALLLNSRVDMRYDVGRVSWWYDPAPSYQMRSRTWTDSNIDRSSTWGLHLRYLGRQDTAGYRVGYTLTGNRKTYPSLPNYDIAPVPRDPGDSWAMSAGIGFSHVRGKHTMVLEAALEPAWAHTWAVLPQHPDATGAVMVAAARTSENWFHFINGHAAAGAERATDWGAWQYGVRVDEIHFSLDRYDYASGTHVESSDGWFEVTPTWGLAVHAQPLEIRYAGHLTTNHFPDMGETKTIVTPVALPGGSLDYLPPAVGPSGRRFWSSAHQVTISIPVGARRQATSSAEESR